MNMGTQMIINTKSIQRFLLGNSGDIFSEGEIVCKNIFYLMKDEIIIKKNDNVRLYETIQFRIEHKSPDGRFDLEYRYVYDVSEYDDISYKLLLVDFIVVKIEKSNTEGNE